MLVHTILNEKFSLENNNEKHIVFSRLGLFTKDKSV